MLYFFPAVHSPLSGCPLDGASWTSILSFMQDSPPQNTAKEGTKWVIITLDGRALSSVNSFTGEATYTTKKSEAQGYTFKAQAEAEAVYQGTKTHFVVPAGGDS